MTCYMGKKASHESEGFQPGCSLKLLSIDLLAEGSEGDLKIEAARKKRRIAY